jgi:hypothetical protein
MEADAKIVVTGTLNGLRTGEYDRKKFATAQLMSKDRTGALRMIEVNLPDNVDLADYPVGHPVTIPVSVTASKEGKLYFRAVEPAADSRTRM